VAIPREAESHSQGHWNLTKYKLLTSPEVPEPQRRRPRRGPTAGI
jgi:hypothetical protein